MLEQPQHEHVSQTELEHEQAELMGEKFVDDSYSDEPILYNNN